MASLELQAKKAELAREILNLDNEEIVDKLSKVLGNLTTKYPCMHTPEEIKSGARQAIEDHKAGKGISHEEMKNRHSA